MAKPEKVASDIKSLKIQGARRIAKAAVEALAGAAKKSKAKSYDEFRSDMLVAADTIAGARPTEPMLRNYLDDLLSILHSMRGHKLLQIKQSLTEKHDEILALMEFSSARIAYYGAEVIPAQGGILVHCHSTTIMAILKAARKMGRRPKVYCTETRPLFQGRMSALELANMGLDVTLIVDSAAGGLLASGKIEMVLVGADAITERGELLNKVGTYSIALCANRAGAKVFSAAELHKYDPGTAGGREEPIEEREGEELLDGERMLEEFREAGVKISNPAFDKTPPELIDAFITEEGLLEPSAIVHTAKAWIGKRVG